MVSPCVASRVNDGPKAIHCFTKAPRGFSDDPEETCGPPTAFQLSKIKKEKNGYRKQHTTNVLTRDKGISSARLLGNVRFLSKVLADNSEKAKQSFSSSQEHLSLQCYEDNTSLTKRRGSKNGLEKSSKNSVSKTTTSMHFAAKTEQARRQQMTSMLNAMAKSGPRPRRDSVVVSMYRTFNDQVLDAKSDPYRVHKWRQKSSRRKLAGMQKTPDEQHGMEGYSQPLRGPKRMQEEDGIQQKDIPKGDRKPKVPIPGVNLLPSLYVNERLESGLRDPLRKEEISLSFARNAAMEELERRFHDDRWKNKKSLRQRSKGADAYGRSDNQVSLAEQRQIRRSEFLKKATASLKYPGSEVVSQSIESVAQTLEDIIKSPENIPHNNNHVYSSQAGSPAVIANEKYGTVSHMKGMSEAVRYKVVKDSFSEETVTIVSKSSEETYLNKRQTPIASRSFKTKLLTGSTEEKVKQKLLNELLPQPKLRSFESKFSVLPDFKKDVNNKGSVANSSTIFSQLHHTLEKTNEQQYQQFSRTHKEAENDKIAPKIPPGKEKRVSLPPLTNVDHRPAREKKAKQKTTLINEEGSSVKSRKVVEFGDSISPLDIVTINRTSPALRKKTSLKTSSISNPTAVVPAKDSTTPVDSVSSKSTGGRRRSQWRRKSLMRADSKGSPQFQRAQRLTKLTKLMGKWRAVVRLSIMFGRLCDDHHIISDDSYNIHFARTKGKGGAVNVKPEVLFDVTDYKTKNQMKLSERCRKVLSATSDERSEPDLRVVRTALRNIKAIADHSASVQENIAKLGYFAGFGSKRVVVLENRRPLNFYVLLAGSAVVVKSDENGNTSPAWFMKRGDVFGEREILDVGVWEWSVITVDPCELLVLDRRDYLNIFLPGGGGGLLSDPDRGEFLSNLSLLQGWPTELLESNPSRCLFRYYKRGTLLTNDSVESDWIYVVKSGSCSVLKPLKVKEMTTREIFRKQMEEQTATFPLHLKPHLVEKESLVNEVEHRERIERIADVLKADQFSVATSYQQIEMASLLKELNLDMKEGFLTPLREEDEEEEESSQEGVMNTSYDQRKKVKISITEGDVEPYKKGEINNTVSNDEAEFRLSRVSDRTGLPRTPSPMKAAYLQTGISHSPQGKQRDMREFMGIGDVEIEQNSAQLECSEVEKVKNETLEKQGQMSLENMSAVDFLSRFDVSSIETGTQVTPVTSQWKQVYVNVRKLTEGGSFGLGSILFNDQPSLALISNGAECLMLHKKFYLDNMTDEVLEKLRELEHPYPDESELLESYWRLISWKAFQQRTVRRLFDHRAKCRHYLNPPKTNVC